MNSLLLIIEPESKLRLLGCQLLIKGIMKRKKKVNATAIVIPMELRTTLNALAKKEERSLGGIIRILLAEAISHRVRK